MNDVEEFLARVGVIRIVEQRFRVALDRGQRRAQFVRHVGDEIAPHLIGFPQLGDVVQHQHGAATGGGHRRDARDQRAGRVARHRQLEAFGFLALQRAADVVDDAGMANRFDVGVIDRSGLELQDPARGVVDELQAAMFVHDQHALDHAGEDRLHPRAVALQRCRRGGRFRESPGPARAPPARDRRRRNRATGARDRRGCSASPPTASS